MEKCLCGSPTKPATKRVVTQGDEIIIVDKVPYFKCTTCSQSYSDPEVVARLAEMVKETPPEGLVAVRVLTFHNTKVQPHE